jgi:hypothetical protein
MIVKIVPVLKSSSRDSGRQGGSPYLFEADLPCPYSL